MSLKTHITHLWIAVTAATVILYSLHSQAQMACEQVFTNKASVYGSSYAALKEAYNSTEDLVEILRTRPAQLTSETLEAEVKRLEALDEAYLKAAGIAYEKLARPTQIQNLKDKPDFILFYNMFRMTGSPTGDETARLIYATQTNPKYQNHPVRFILDPLYKLNYPTSSGHFIAETTVLTIGPHVIADETMGMTSTLRHETQHYLEQVKVLNGENTLARAVFTEEAPKSTDRPYAKFLRMDELETHLRDLRLIKNQKLWQSRDLRLAQVMAGQKVAQITKARAFMIHEKISTLSTLTENSLAMLKNLEGLKPENVTVNKRTQAIEVHFAGLSGPYSSARIELTGLLSVDEIQDLQKIEALVKQVLSWQRTRVEQVAHELTELKQKE